MFATKSSSTSPRLGLVSKTEATLRLMCLFTLQVSSGHEIQDSGATVFGEIVKKTIWLAIGA